MIQFINLNKAPPYKIFKEKYSKALSAGEKNIEAISITSFDKKKNEVDSRYVNLKFIDNVKFIFFSNYNSPKSIAFKSHDQISALLYWQSINAQIRIKAKINETSKDYNREYFKQRSIDKNALAISSNQSRVISSYDDLKAKYKNVRENEDLLKCPENWGGFYFIPYYFEFWEGHESRINKREAFDKINGIWKHSFLQP
jgi:pyridoxamine-phosphate oxidase